MVKENKSRGYCGVGQRDFCFLALGEDKVLVVKENKSRGYCAGLAEADQD
jgi:hypothetical protein